MTNKEYDSEAIEKYLRKELNAEEQSAFEKSMFLDPALAEEVKLQQEVFYGIDAYFSREQWKKLLQEKEALLRAKEVSQHQRGNRTFTWLMAIAASFLLLATAGYFFLSASPSAPELFEAYYQPYPNVAAPLERSGHEKTVSGPFALYEQQAYKAAIPAFEKAMANQLHPQPALLLYYSLSLIETGRINEAVSLLEVVDNSQDVRFAKPARWYLALAYLKLNQKEEAQKLLQALAEENTGYTAKAKQLLKDL